ncbi:unnamed protein product, partial [Polarella glacialis]
EFATTDYAERQIERLCSRRESLYKVPFVITAFMKAGVSLSCLMRAETCGYLLLLALASQSFNFVYILVKEAVNLKPIFELFESQFLKLTKKALNTRPNALAREVLDLLHFCGFQLSSNEAAQGQFDAELLKFVLTEELAPIERMCRLGYCLLGLAVREQVRLQICFQTGLEAISAEQPAVATKARAQQPSTGPSNPVQGPE